jgi:2-keto-3-deoxy-L-rhamnonate aldolase RhmA
MSKTHKEFIVGRRPLFGTLLTLPVPEIAEICVEAGIDWLFIDMEHGLLDATGVQRIIQAVAGRRPCVVRVAMNEASTIAKALDTGADGLIFPHINTAGEARAAVCAAQYPPEGARSIGIARAQGYGARLAESIENANREIALIAQAEHIDAARNIDSILAVPGIDAVFIGPNDLSASLGLPGRTAEPAVLEAIGNIRRAAAKARKPSGIFVRDAASARRAAEEGQTLICVASDTLLLGNILRETISALKPQA